MHTFLRALPKHLVLCWLLLVFLPCSAEQQDRYAPIHFQTDQWVYDDLKQINTLTGHVVLTKGTILIKADHITVRKDPAGYQYIKATTRKGSQAYFRQKRDGLNEYIEGRGDTITYDDRSQIATMLRHARVARLQGLTKILDEVQGSMIRYDHANNIYSAHSGSDFVNPGNPNGRVQAMLAPDIKPAQTPESCSADLLEFSCDMQSPQPPSSPQPSSTQP